MKGSQQERPHLQPSKKKRKATEETTYNTALSENVKQHIASLDALSDIYSINGWKNCTVGDCPSYAKLNFEPERNINNNWIHRTDHADCTCDYNPKCLVSLGVFPPNGAIPNINDRDEILVLRDYTDLLFRKYVMVEKEKISQHVSKMIKQSDDLPALMQTIHEYNRSLLSSNLINEQENDDTKVFICIPAGMKNFGATCYVNSQLQCLALMPPFVDELLSWTGDEQMRSRDGNIVSCMQELFLEVNFGWSCEVSPLKLVDLMGLEHDEQQDPFDFSDCLLHKLEEQGAKLNEIFHGQETNVTKCLTCTHSFEKNSDFFALIVPIELSNKRGKAKAVDFNNCINNYFNNEEKVDEYRCPQCHAVNATATRNVKLKSAPNILTITLDRYRYNQNVAQKIKQKVLIPRTLTLTDVDNTLEEYTLCSVVSYKDLKLKTVMNYLFFEFTCALFLFRITSCHT